ncbi:unnamed protein product [Rhizophagus irregularis]|nr:unnamed protein product [Rhizophagus irregularis]
MVDDGWWIVNGKWWMVDGGWRMVDDSISPTFGNLKFGRMSSKRVNHSTSYSIHRWQPKRLKGRYGSALDVRLILISLSSFGRVKAYSIARFSKTILPVYGISRDPDTKNYIMVLDYAEGGNLYRWISEHYNNIDWSHIINALLTIIGGLKEIHQKKLVHHDFHTGNILSTSVDLNFGDSLCISDMGLCREVNNPDETKLYGVMPYVAPEVLRGGQSYTQAADVYSFGMIMYVMATGKQPFNNRVHDQNLLLDICEDGIRPKINEQEAPECYIDLIKRCWDSNPDNRPNEFGPVL